MKKGVLIPVFFLLAALGSTSAQNYNVFVGEKFNVRLGKNTHTYSVERADGDIPVPDDTAMLAAKTARFADMINTDSDFAYVMDEGRKSAWDSEKLVRKYIVSDVFKTVLNQADEFQQEVRDKAEYIMGVANDFSDAVLYLDVRGIGSLFNRLNDSLSQKFYGSENKSAAKIISDPEIYLWREACEYANAFIEVDGIISGMQRGDWVTYNNTEHYTREIRDLVSRVWNYPSLLQGLHENPPNGLNSEEIRAAVEATDFGEVDQSGYISSLRDQANIIIQGTSEYQDFMQQVENSRRELAWLQGKVSVQGWHRTR